MIKFIKRRLLSVSVFVFAKEHTEYQSTLSPFCMGHSSSPHL